MDRCNYTQRLNIPLTGNDQTKFYSKSGQLLATGYTRVVLGDRGPYVEHDIQHINPVAFNESQTPHKYYIEWRSIKDNVKAYFQCNLVDYADYRIGYIYISPFELYDQNGIVLITPLR